MRLSIATRVETLRHRIIRGLQEEFPTKVGLTVTRRSETSRFIDVEVTFPLSRCPSGERQMAIVATLTGGFYFPRITIAPSCFLSARSSRRDVVDFTRWNHCSSCRCRFSVSAWSVGRSPWFELAMMPSSVGWMMLWDVVDNEYWIDRLGAWRTLGQRCRLDTASKVYAAGTKFHHGRLMCSGSAIQSWPSGGAAGDMLWFRAIPRDTFAHDRNWTTWQRARSNG